MKKAAGRASARYELIDLADYPLPRVEEPMPPPLGPLRRGAHESLAAKIAEYDGFVFVTPGYKRSTSGVLKDAIDFACTARKAAALVGYGRIAGARHRAPARRSSRPDPARRSGCCSP
ncbi:MAG: hypothetical protein QOG05_1121 [Streptosporangiaceae bacterium]|jgi:NAD(P)H-dependent FMN reductase|nr:hypothetical protein [Streptosporangiaceae bacterium]